VLSNSPVPPESFPFSSNNFFFSFLFWGIAEDPKPEPLIFIELFFLFILAFAGLCPFFWD
jgi:hypothetical protein